MGGLERLPTELLALIVSYFETARTLLHLSITCKKLHGFIENDGFRVFVQNRFPSIQIPPYWKDATHAMTTLSRNWDRRAFVARYLAPGPGNTRAHPRHNRDVGIRTLPPGIQTMGYRPVIDSYEEWTGNAWSSRKQILAWGAGPSLFLRLKRIKDSTNPTSRHASSQEQNQSILDQHYHESTWTELKDSRFTQMKDDITSVNLLRSRQKPKDDHEYVVIGRANGVLNLVSVSTTDFHKVNLTEFETKNRAVKSATISEPLDPLLAVCLSDSSLALYRVQTNKGYTEPCDETTTIAAGKPVKTWSARFLRHNRLAIGLGPSEEPVQVYDVRPDGLSKDPIRRFSIEKAGRETTELGNLKGVLTSVYPIVPVAPSSSAGGAEGDIFLSGGHDGSVRLHDLRSPEPCVTVFTDLVDTFSPIYSLESFGRERFIAGGARHALLKIFDLRLPGGKLYHATDLDPCSSRSTRSRSGSFSHTERKADCCQYHYDARHNCTNTNIFIGDYELGHRFSRQQTSPIYSLSSPSPCSPTFFVGIEQRILQIDAVSIMDRHPDPIFRNGPKQGANQDSHLRMKWNPHLDVISLTSYEQKHGSVDLNVQQRVGDIRGSGVGIDERWQSRLHRS